MLQTTYAHEELPHAVITELVANNTAGKAALHVTVGGAPSQPARSSVGGSFKGGKPLPCMHWRPHSTLPSGHEVMIGVLAEEQKKGGNVSVAVASLPSPPALVAAAGAFSPPLVLPSSRYSSADGAGDPAAAVSAEIASLVAAAPTLRLRHERAYAGRQRNAAPISIEGNLELATLMNASWFAVMGSAPRPEPALNRFGTGISSIATNGYSECSNGLPLRCPLTQALAAFRRPNVLGHGHLGRTELAALWAGWRRGWLPQLPTGRDAHRRVLLQRVPLPRLGLSVGYLLWLHG